MCLFLVAIMTVGQWAVRQSVVGQGGMPEPAVGNDWLLPTAGCLCRPSSLAGDCLHLLFRRSDRLVDLAVEDGALDHLDPRARIAVDHVVEVEDPRHIADAERLGGGDDTRL